ncbi:hypothetical protein ACGYJ8_13835 [Sulfitobacter sp. 1A12126]|uniref:hypothetical protein n=1 Tax=Sulfitobacter sp. 1A12126 TaxID=3368591 RepID=UPI00374627A9
MISPEGYYPFSALLTDALEDTLYSEAEDYLVANSRSPATFFTDRRDDVVLDWVFDYCGQEMFVCNGEGSIHRIDSKVLDDNRYSVDLTSKMLAGDKAVIVPENIRRDFKFCEPLQTDDVDPFNALVDKHSRAQDPDAQAEFDSLIRDHLRELAETDGFTRPPIFFEPYTGKIDLRLFRYLYESDAIKRVRMDSREIVRLGNELQQVEGWTVAISASLIGESWKVYATRRSTKHKKKLESLLLDKKPSMGRPRKQDLAVKTFHEMYPDGLGNSTWVEAAYRIGKKTGEPIHPITLKRGLRTEQGKA